MTAQTFLSRDPAIPQDQKQNLPAAKQKKPENQKYVDMYGRIRKIMSPVKELKVSES